MKYKVGDAIYFNYSWYNIGHDYMACTIEKIEDNLLWGHWKQFDHVPTIEEIKSKKINNWHFVRTSSGIKLLEPSNKNRRIVKEVIK